MVRQFHGSDAPGLLIGGFMVSLAHEDLPAGALYDAVCETTQCLPDAVQILTPCTVGNGWLKIIPWGRYAVTFYDKSDINHGGVRVFIDSVKIRDWPEIAQWFFKLKNSREQDKHGLIAQIAEARETILGIQHIRIRHDFAERKRKGAVSICPKCKEAYPARDGEMCLACRDYSVYA